jgi:hypothetical protein
MHLKIMLKQITRKMYFYRQIVYFRVFCFLVSVLIRFSTLEKLGAFKCLFIPIFVLREVTFTVFNFQSTGVAVLTNIISFCSDLFYFELCVDALD